MEEASPSRTDPGGPASLARARLWIPRALAAAVFCGYALVAPGGFYWLDSAELSAAGLDLGSAHPTGFPLYVIAVRAVAWLPVGELAYRVELLSALCAALAVLWTGRLVIELGRGEAVAVVGAAAAGLTLAVSLVFFRQGTVAEVYAPTAALLAGSLYLFDRAVVSGDPRPGLALAVVVGLGLGTHASYALALPVFAVLAVVRLRRGARWPLAVPLCAVLGAGALYAYLPVRSATGETAAVDWGHPDRVGALFDHVTAQRVRRAYGDQMRATAPERVRHNLGVVAADTADALGPVALLAGLAGLAWLFRHRRTRWTAAALAVVVVGDFVYAFWINPMGQVDRQNGVPLAFGAAVCAGVGLAWFGRTLGRVGPYAVGVAGVIMAVPPAMIALPEVTAARAGELPRRWARAALEDTPTGGIAIVENDSLAAGLIYLTVAENARPDVAVLVKQHLWDVERTRRVLARSSERPVDIDPDDPLGSVLASGRPIAWEVGAQPIPPGRTLVAGAPLSRLRSDEAPRPDGDVRAAVAELQRLFDHPGARDAAARRTRAVALTQLGRVAVARGALDLATVVFDAALAVRPGHVAALVNRGAVAARRGDFARAAHLTDRAIARDPLHVTARLNAARFHQRLGNEPDARGHVDAVLEITPGNASAWALSALLHLNAGKPEKAASDLDRALALDPRNSDALDLLRQLKNRRGR